MSATLTVPAHTTTTTRKATTGGSITRLSASCQQLISEDFTSFNGARVVVRSCCSDPALLPSISEHKCNNVPLTPGGLFADMAVVVAEYIWKRSRGFDAPKPGINVCDLHIEKPTIVKLPPDPDGQWCEMEARVDIPEYSSGDLIDATIHCQFRSIRPNGTKIQDQGHGIVKYEFYPGWLASWSSNSTATILNKINNLHTRAITESSGAVRLVHRQKAYELFKTFVDYGPKYQNMSTVVFDTETMEAYADMTFQPNPAVDYTGPYYIDGSCHLSGFLCNAVDENIDKNAYISNGFSSMKLSPHFEPSRQGTDIKTYVRMQPMPNDKSVLSGDVYVLQDGEIVGLWESVRFKRIPRKVLNVFLPPPKK